MKMITISQKPRPAHVQPAASSRPNRTRRRGTVAPGPSACWAIVLPSCLLGRERAGHVRMDRAEEGVRARSAPTWTSRTAGPGNGWLSSRTALLASRMSTSCGTLASWLSKLIVKSTLAGARTSVVVNWIPDATISTGAVPGRRTAPPNRKEPGSAGCCRSRRLTRCRTAPVILGELVGPAGGERRGVRLGLVIRVHPAGECLDFAGDRIDPGLHELRVALRVGLRVLGADERDQLLDLDVVQGAWVPRSTRSASAIGVAAGIPPADRQDVVQVRLVEMLEQLVLAVESRPDAAFPVHAVTARAVGFVDVVAALD